MKPLRTRVVAVGLLGLAVTVLTASATNAQPSDRAAVSAKAHRCPVATGSGDAAFVRNFNPFAPGSMRDFTVGGIYEQLVISTAFGGGRIYKWLAEDYEWSKDGKTLTLTIRSGVKWSDGKPLTVQDVLYSLTAGRQDKSMDKLGVYAEGTNIQSVKIAGKNKVAIRFKQRDSTFVGSSLSGAIIVPKHIWSKVKDVANFTNPRPVGSGPFNRIDRFTPESYVLGRNPGYWQEGRPMVPCLQRLRAASNDAALLQLISGQADWSHNFIPNVEKAYIARDKKNYHHSYLTTALPIGLYFDTTKYPYSLAAFRKGISRAIDRKKVSVLGEYGYAPPTSALGIEFMYPKWIDAGLKAKAAQMSTYSPAAARQIFTSAGFSYKGDDLFDPRGDRVRFSMHVIGGWSDWVASLNIIANNLEDVGIDASVKLEPDWGAWQPNAMSTKFVTLLWNYGGGDITPYRYFYSQFDPSQNLGPGVDSIATGNWHHFQDEEGAALLRQFKGTLDRSRQQKLANRLQAIFLDKLPFVPLFVGPRWSTYSTKYFTGWVTSKNQYVDPIFSEHNQVGKILVSLRPKK